MPSPLAPDGPAPGAPGLEPRWTTSAKSGIGTASDGRCRLWFALSHGIVDEVYFPRVDQANTRDLGLLVTDAGPAGDPAGSDFFCEEKRHTHGSVHLLAPGVPGYRLVNLCNRGRFRIVKTVVADPERSVLMQHVRFEPLIGELDVYRLFVLLAPHIGNQGRGNDGWAGDYKGVPMLFGDRAETSLALAAAPHWAAMSCGYVGASDGWQQISAHRRLVACYDAARDGNIALTGEIDLAAARQEDGSAEFRIALAFGGTPAEAGQSARMSLASPFRRLEASFVAGWQRFHAESRGAPVEGVSEPVRELYEVSTAIIAAHEDKRAQGGLIASLSIPWGQTRGDHDMGGYHLVWPRDLVESAGALLAAGHHARARRTLRYLMSTQEADGHWPQNMWLDGSSYWNGIQMDETALPVLYADLLRRRHELGDMDPWPMVRRAAAFLVRGGPVTQQDRWEEDGGYSPFTLAAEVAALLAAADFAEARGRQAEARYLRDTADAWNEGIERWTWVAGTALAREVGVEGYYARIAPPDVGTASSTGLVPIRNRPPQMGDAVCYEGLVSPDALALVRFGLRAADDPRIVATVKVIDAVLRRETRTGPVWLRYNGDGYGEHENGAPFDGTGIGRGWPLLAGERGHYELAAGRAAEALRLLEVMHAQANGGGMLPEQIWDADDIPARELVNGCPAGSAMPLVWAHAEFVKLVRSVVEGRVFDLPPQTVGRYLHARRRARLGAWSACHRIRTLAAGRALRIQTPSHALIHWSADDWRTVARTPTDDTGLGVQAAELPVAHLAAGARVKFTLYWPHDSRWEGQDYEVQVIAP